MATIALTDTQRCNAFLQQCVRTNVVYWQDFIENHAKDVGTLEQEWEGVVKAIVFGLELKEEWPLVYSLIIEFSNFMERRGYWDSWQTILDRALKTAPQTNSEPNQVNLVALSARLWQRQGDYKQMLAKYRHTIQLARRHNDLFNEGRAYTNLGFFYVEHGQWYRAEVLCCHALHLFETLNYESGQAHTDNHLGVLYTRQKQWEKAQHHLDRACKIWASMADDYGLMFGFMNLGLFFIEKDRPSEALVWSKKALEKAQLAGEASTIGTIKLNIGISYRLQGDFTQAEQYLRQAETIFHHYSNLLGLARVLGDLGLMYQSQQNYSKARLYIELALRGWRNIGNKYGEIR
ncbi:MAG: tetratricopeptide repeat protein, partial [Chloroflexota bacterium]